MTRSAQPEATRPGSVAVAVGVAVAVAGVLALAGCSGAGSGPAKPSGPAVPPSAATGGPGVDPSAAAGGGPAAGPSGAGRDPKSAGQRTPESAEQRIAALSTAGGVSSLVLRLSSTGQVPSVRSTRLGVGQTLRVVVVSPVATHLTGKGLGVDVDVPAGSPTAVDVVAFTAGDYVLTGAGGAVLLKAAVRG